MIHNQWYVVLESKEVPHNKPIGVTRMGEKLVFWRDQDGKISCLRDFCPHRGVALSQGKILGNRLQCPFHGFEYDGSGCATFIPANGRAAPKPKQMRALSYPTFEAHGFIYLWWGEFSERLPEPRFFDNLGDDFTYGSIRDHWKTHYSRVIENQLDVAHLPFIHYNTIGRDGRAVVDGPLVEWQDSEKFFVYTFNRLDDGTPPRKPSQLSSAGKTFHLEFIFPNLWQNYISGNVRVVAAFTPVDNDNTILYLRFYQNFMRIPLLSKMVNALSMPFNVYIAHQDRRIVETQLPKKTGLKIGEKLIQADGPIIAYRKRREELIALSSRQPNPENPSAPTRFITSKHCD